MSDNDSCEKNPAILVEVTRGKIVECRHRGSIVAVDTSGTKVFSIGDGEQLCYMRSTIKPFQSIPLLEFGVVDQYGITDEELAVICGSHIGEPYHVRLVHSILEKAGLSPEYLKCGTHEPFEPEILQDLLSRGESVNQMNHNCSGNHAGMLLLTKALGYDLATYDAPSSPVQTLYLHIMTEMLNLKNQEIQIDVDNCNVPAIAIPLRKIALAYALLGTPFGQPSTREQALQHITKAMTRFPYAVGGLRSFQTALMEHTNGQFIAKIGADGILCIAAREKAIGIAIKIESGVYQAAQACAVGVLKKMGMITESVLNDLDAFYRRPVLSTSGKIVGRFQVVM